MRWLRKNKADAVLALLAVALAVMAGLFAQGLYHDAEAVIGEAGNLGTDQNNRHNFAAGTPGVRAVSEGRICIFCHTPHTSFSNAALLDPPLWNHKMSSVVSYDVKTSGDTITNATIGNFTLLSTPPDMPDGASKLCLSCHDGTISIGAVYSRSVDIAMENTCFDPSGAEVAGLSEGVLTSACYAYIGTDLRNKHVVSIPMNQALIDASFANCTSQGGTATTHVKYPWQSAGSDLAQPDTVLLRPVGADKTFDGNTGVTYPTTGMPADKYKSGYYYGVQCSTCHDPHYWVEDLNSTKGDVAGEYFLVNTFNNICQACHTTDSCS